jgi:hypothetical protein
MTTHRTRQLNLGSGTAHRRLRDHLLPKVQAEDLAELDVGQVVWGHCVPDTLLALTQIAIDRRLTMIAFDAVDIRGGFYRTTNHTAT